MKTKRKPQLDGCQSDGTPTYRALEMTIAWFEQEREDLLDELDDAQARVACLETAVEQLRKPTLPADLCEYKH